MNIKYYEITYKCVNYSYASKQFILIEGYPCTIAIENLKKII